METGTKTCRCNRPISTEYSTCGACRDRRKDLRVTPKGRAHKLWSGAKNRAKKKGLEFSLSLDLVIDGVSRGYCEKLGHHCPFDLRSKGCHSNPWAPSIDRIDPKKGYTDDNVQIVCWIYNLAKASWPPQIFRKFILLAAQSENFLGEI